jgi:hypothetical protein
MCKSFDEESKKVETIGYSVKKLQKNAFGRTPLWKFLLVIFTLAAWAFHRIKLAATLEMNSSSECVFIGGGGHGAVLFRFGQLEHFMRHNRNNVTEYYCSSAGCIAAAFLVSGLPRSAIGDVYKRVYERVDAEYMFPTPGSVVDYACDELPSWLNTENLDRLKKQLNVLTTTFGVGLNSRKPQSHSDLRVLLRQSTWIPYFTSNGLYHVDEHGIKHIDGDFLTKLFPPQCQHSFDTPFLTHFDLSWHLFIPVRSVKTMFDLVQAGADYQSRKLFSRRAPKSCYAPFCFRGIPRIKL